MPFYPGLNDKIPSHISLQYKWVEKRQPFNIQMSQIEIKRIISQDEKVEIETDNTY